MYRISHGIASKARFGAAAATTDPSLGSSINTQLLNSFRGKHVVLSLREYDTDELIQDSGLYNDIVVKWKLHPETVVKPHNETAKPFFLGARTKEGYFGRIWWDGEEQTPPIPYLVTIYPTEPLKHQKTIIEEFQKTLPFQIRPPDPHDLISRHAGTEEQKMKAWQVHIDAVIAEAIRDEEDAVRKYQHLLEEMDKSPAGYTQGRELVAHIREQEIGHAALLKRLRS